MAREYKKLQIDELECNSKLKEFKHQRKDKEHLHHQTQLMAKRIMNETN